MLSDKAAKGFATGMKGINEAQKSGAWNEMTRFIDSVKGTGPEAAAWEVFMAKLTSETVGARIDLLKSVLVAMESPGGVLFLDAVSGILNLFATTGETAAAAINGVSTAIAGLFDIDPENMTALQTALDKIKTYLTDPDEWEFSTNWWIDKFKTFSERMQGEFTASLTWWKQAWADIWAWDPLGDFFDRINKWIANIMGYDPETNSSTTTTSTEEGRGYNTEEFG